MILHGFVFCCLGSVFFTGGEADRMEILEERNIFKEFMKYPLNNPRKDLDLQVLSLHLRPITRKKSTRNGLDEMNPHIGPTIEQDGRRKDTARQPAKSRTNHEVPQTPKRKSQQELEYEKLLKKYLKRKGRSKHHNKPQRPSKVREPKVMQDKEEGEEYKEVKRKTLRSRRIDLFTRPGREKQPNGKRPSVPGKVKPAHEDYQRTELPWNWVDVRHLILPPMLDGEMLDEERPLIYSQLGGENYYNTKQGDILQKANEEIMQEQAPWEGSREHVLLGDDRHRKLKSLESGGEEKSREPSHTEDHQEITQSSLITMANQFFHSFPDEGAEETSFMLLPARNGVRDDELPQDNQKLWRKSVLVEKIPIIDIYSDTIHPVAIHDGPHRADHLWSQDEMLLQAEGSGRDKMALDQEDNILTLIPNKGSAQTTQATPEVVSLSQPTTTIQNSSYNTSLSPTSGNYTESELLHDGKFSPLEATLKHNPGPMYCKPGYKEYGGVCKSQCEVDGINCGSNGQCVIVENIGPMCRCQQMNSLCYGGECCRSSLTPFQLACVIGGCCILLSVFLGSLPFLIRKVDIKSISKSMRTRLWISTLMPHSSTSLSSQSADLTICSNYESAPDLSSLYRANKMTCNSTMLPCERTRL